ncbi:PP0621 family protein [Roseateles sp. SL47]|jgi:uncharacterized protein|uniref:PP0621 family protein n=1 Tax=Roseateles sp. SL47 TaxID=2995138 RepID=UPI0022711C10|nr:PP0621 family protein [Roseateles sp. SL47]WAC74856.1 PP0621 family protein [Roseateles sp. SL47]
MKLLFWVLVLALFFFVLGFKRGRPDRSTAPPAPSPSQRPVAAPAAEPPPEDMVSCAECGTHLPISESLPGRGGHFCCADHRVRFEARLG